MLYVVYVCARVRYDRILIYNTRYILYARYAPAGRRKVRNGNVAPRRANNRTTFTMPSELAAARLHRTRNATVLRCTIIIGGDLSRKIKSPRRRPERAGSINNYRVRAVYIPYCVSWRTTRRRRGIHRTQSRIKGGQETYSSGSLRKRSPEVWTKVFKKIIFIYNIFKI